MSRKLLPGPTVYLVSGGGRHCSIQEVFNVFKNAQKKLSTLLRRTICNEKSDPDLLC